MKTYSTIKSMAIVLLLSLVSGSIYSQANTVFIDPSLAEPNTGEDGSSGNPFNSFQDFTWTSGKTYLLKRNSELNINATCTITAANIIIGAYDEPNASTQEKPIIRSSVSGSDGIFYMEEKEKITFKDIALSNVIANGNHPGYGIYVKGAYTDNINIINCTLNSMVVAIKADGTTSGISDIGHNLKVTDCDLSVFYNGKCFDLTDFNNIEIENTPVFNGFPGIYANNINAVSSGENSLKITNCEIRSNFQYFYGMELQSCTNAKIEGCTIYDAEYGVKADLCDDLKINNCDVYDIFKIGVKITSSDDAIITHCRIKDANTLNGSIGPLAGSYLRLNGCDNFQIDNNTFSCTGAYTCENYVYVKEVSTSGNIFNNTFLGTDYIAKSIRVGNGTFSIYNNMIEGSVNGIATDYLSTTIASSNIHHNIIKDCRDTSIYIGQSSDADIYHNDIYNGANTTSFIAIHVEAQCSTCTQIANNIFYFANQAGKLYNFSYSGNAETDYNFTMEGFTNFIMYGSTPYSLFSAYKTATNNGTNSIYLQADPMFEDAASGDFRLATGSPCIDEGETNTAYQQDYYGNPVPSKINTPTDIGAYEFAEETIIDWASGAPSGWYYATEEIVANYPKHKVGSIYYNGKLVYIRGVNWAKIGFGNSCDLTGLWDGPEGANLMELLDLIKSLGFNTIRITIDGNMIRKEWDTGFEYENGVDCIAYSNTQYFTGVTTEFEALERVVQHIRDKGMYVLLEQLGMLYPENLWYDPYDQDSKDDYIQNLTYLANTFKTTPSQNYDNVIGIEIINEPFGAKWNISSTSNNFKHFVEQASVAIQNENPGMLIFVEGIQYHDIAALEVEEAGLDTNNPYDPEDEYGWAESLSAISVHPLQADKAPAHKIIYSPHCYQWKHDFIIYYTNQFINSTITNAEYKAKLKLYNDFRWVNGAIGNTLIPSEYGALFYDPTYTHSKRWLGPFIEYMAESKLPGSFYWSINGNDYVDVYNTTNQTWEKAYLGLIQNDWSTVHQDKMDTVAILFGRVKGTAPFTNDLYSPRDGTRYNFPSNSLTSGDVVEHTAHWAGDGDGTQYAYDVLDAMDDYGELHDILHAFKVTRNGSMSAPASNNFTITIKYTEEELGWVCENTLGFYKYNNSVWTKVTTGVVSDVTNNKISLTTSDFGIYAVLGTEVAQRTDLLAGWSIWSTYINPYNPNMANVFSRVLNMGNANSNLIILKDGAGGVLWPEYSLNTIASTPYTGNHTVGEGYQVKMTTADFIRVRGNFIKPENTTITITSGWSILAYLRKTPANIVVMLSPIVNNIDMVKNGAGQLYWPLYVINNIGNMMPGEGYQIKLFSQVYLTYPINDSKSVMQNSTCPVLVYKNYTEDIYINTDNNMVVGIPYASWGTPPEIGDEIAAIGESGQLVGKTVFNGGFSALTVYGDDFYTPDVVENLANAESFSFEVWSTANKSTKNYHFKNWVKGDGKFTKNEIAIVAVDKEKEIEPVFEMDVYPNPGEGLFIISIFSSEKQEAEVALYDVNGKLVYSDEITVTEGKQSFRLDFTSLGKGTYTLKLICGDLSKKAKLIILK